ncbi:MAG: O-antigen ligase family protein [Chakrabartia sp.]
MTSAPAVPSQRLSWPFGLLGLLLLLVFCVGGSSRPDPLYDMLLRLGAAAGLIGGALTLRRSHVEAYRGLFAFVLAIVALPLVQLLPLPPGLAAGLSHQAIIVDIDRAAGLEGVWRPLSLTPDATRAFFWSLLLPLAVIVLGVQLTLAERGRLVGLLLAIGLVSGLVALAQTLADDHGPLYWYEISNNGSAIGLFANRNHQAVFLACLLPMLVAWYRVTGFLPGPSGDRLAGPPRLLGRTTMVGGILALGLLILITGSRAGLVVACVAGVSLPFVLGLRTRRRGGSTGQGALSPWQKAAPPLIVLGMVGLGGLAIWLRRAEAFDRLFSSSPADDLRFQILPTISNLVQLYAPWGSGLGGFETIFKIHEPAALLSPNYVNHVHNDWLELALTGGVPAGVLVIAALFAYARVARATLRQRPRTQQDFLARMGLAILLLLALASLSDYPMRTAAIACLFTFAALCIAAPQADVDGGDAGGAARALPWLAALVIGGGAVAAPVLEADYAPASAGQEGVDPARQMAVARARLRDVPLDVTALRDLGQAQNARRVASGTASLRLAERVSRRDVTTQLALLDEASRAGDLPEIIRHYDIILSVTPELNNLLLPKLAATLGDERVRGALLPYVERPWFDGFLMAALAGPGDPRDVARMLQAAGRLGPPQGEDRLPSALLRSLLARGYPYAARRVALSLVGDADLLENMAVSTKTSDPALAPLSWTLSDDNVVDSEMPDENRLELTIAGEARHLALGRVTLLPPGAYLFDQVITYDRPPFARLKWSLTCLGAPGAPPIWEQQMPLKPGRLAYQSRIAIPNGCVAQTWQLWAYGAQSQSDTKVVISNLALSRQ